MYPKISRMLFTFAMVFALVAGGLIWWGLRTAASAKLEDVAQRTQRTSLPEHDQHRIPESCSSCREKQSLAGHMLSTGTIIFALSVTCTLLGIYSTHRR